MVGATALACTGVHAGSADAAVTLHGDEEVIVAAHEVIADDLIVFSPYVRVDGLVRGDLVAIGEEVVVEGVVEQDLVAIGKTVYLNGRVNDDARIAAYAIAFGERAHVADDLFEASYSLETLEGSNVGGTLFAASRQALLAGSVVEDVRLRAGALALRGLTGGDVRAVVGGLEGFTHSDVVIDLSLEIPQVEDGIRVASTAVIGGELDHRSPAPAVVEQGANIAGGVRHEAWRTTPRGPVHLPGDAGEDTAFADRATAAGERLAVLLGVGLCLAVAVPGWLVRRGLDVRAQPAGRMGWGVGAVLFGAIASIAVGVAFSLLLAIGLSTGSGGLAWTAVSAGGLLQMALFALFGIAIFFVGPVLASAALGGAVLARLRPASDGANGEAKVLDAALLVAVGAVGYAVLRAVPVLGWLFGLTATLAGTGALAWWLREVFLDPPESRD